MSGDPYAPESIIDAEREEQRTLPEDRRPVRINGQRYDPDEVPTRAEAERDER